MARLGRAINSSSRPRQMAGSGPAMTRETQARHRLLMPAQDNAMPVQDNPATPGQDNPATLMPLRDSRTALMPLRGSPAST
jgi:hypothetical protein